MERARQASPLGVKRSQELFYIATNLMYT